jgi:hypothetical protein
MILDNDQIESSNLVENLYDNESEINETIRVNSILSGITSLVGFLDIDEVLFKYIIQAEDYDIEKCLEKYLEFYEGTEMTENKIVFFTNYLSYQNISKKTENQKLQNFSENFSDYNKNVKNDIINYNKANNVCDNNGKDDNSINEDNFYGDLNDNENYNNNENIKDNNNTYPTDIKNDNSDNDFYINKDNINKDNADLNAVNIDHTINNVSTSVRAMSLNFDDFSIEKERIDREFAIAEKVFHSSNLNINAHIFYPRSEINEKKNEIKNENENCTLHNQKNNYFKMFNDLIEEKILDDFWLETYSQVVTLTDNHENQRKTVDFDSNSFDEFGVNFVSDVMNRAINMALIYLDSLDLWMSEDMMEESMRYYDKDDHDSDTNNDRYSSNYIDDFSDEEFDSDETIARFIAQDEENLFFNSNINLENENEKNFEKNLSTQNVLLDMVKNIFGNNNCKYSDKLISHVLKVNDYNIESTIESLMIYKDNKSLSLHDFQKLNNDDNPTKYNYKSYKNKDNKYTDFSYANILKIKNNDIIDHNCDDNDDVYEKNHEISKQNIRNIDDENVRTNATASIEVIWLNCRVYLCFTGWVCMICVGHKDKILKPFSML